MADEGDTAMSFGRRRRGPAAASSKDLRRLFDQTASKDTLFGPSGVKTGHSGRVFTYKMLI
jgi:hypothetical protein